MGSVLVIAPHPDDETLGCRCTLLNHLVRGDSLYWVIGTRVWELLYSAEAVRQQAEQVRAVEAAYPFAKTESLNFETTRMDSIPLNEAIHRLRKVLGNIKPEGRLPAKPL